MEIVLVTGSSMPRPDTESPLLVAALRALGATADLVPWDSDRDWAAADLVAIRTTWDYVGRLPEFLAWADRVAAATRLVNPVHVVRWNAHKSYLLELAGRGVAVVPTRLVRRGERGPELAAVGADVVVKPAVSVGSRGAMRGAGDDPELAAHLARLAETGDVLVQPFVDSVVGVGETSLLYAGGTLSHAVRKIPAAGDYRVQDHYGGSVVAHTPTADERRVAAAALAAAPGPCVYARVDLVATPAGPALMELELIEPQLFLARADGAAERFASALLAVAGG